MRCKCIKICWNFEVFLKSFEVLYVLHVKYETPMQIIFFKYFIQFVLIKMDQILIDCEYFYDHNSQQPQESNSFSMGVKEGTAVET